MIARGARHLSLAGHLEELRRRLAISIGAFLIASGLSWMQVERIIGWLRRPAGELLPYFAYFSPVEPLLAYLKVAGLCGLILAMPVILLQVWGFVRPGLTRRERSLGLAFVWWGSLLFAGGAAFAYGALVPTSLRLLLGVGRGTLQPMLSIDRYLSYVTGLVFWCGLVFELPAVLYLLARIGVVTPPFLRQQRPYAILLLVIVAAIMTPTTDVVNLLLMTVPLLLLYELSILVTALAMRRRGPA